MDLNTPGMETWGLPLGSRLTRKLIPLRPEKQALDVIRRASGRLTSKQAEKTEDQQLREAAQDFEAVFLFQVLKQVRNTIHREDFLNGGVAEDMFTGMLDEEYAKVMARTGTTGLSNVLYQQLSRLNAGEVENNTRDGIMPHETVQSTELKQRLRDLQQEIKAANRAAAQAAAELILP